MLNTTLLNNRYQLLNKLGSGGMSEVYRAHDLTLERIVTVKLLREDFSSDISFTDKFHQEAKAAANLSHPNIVTIHDFGLDSERLYIVMEYVPGKDLKSILKEKGILPLNKSLSLMVQACSGVGYAHRAGLVHCDVKPHNMLVTPENNLKVTDFGIARALAAIHPDEKSDVVWGSPQYFSPEQAAGNAPSPASDVYSLGIVFYEMITGRLPFTGNSAIDLANAHQFISPPPPSSINPDIPEGVENILMKVLSKEPSLRYRNADQLGRILVLLQRQFMEDDLENVQAELLLDNVDLPGRVEKLQRSTNQVEASKKIEKKQSVTYNPLDIDWVTWGLGLLALIALGGLIPLWLWVYLLYNAAR